MFGAPYSTLKYENQSNAYRVVAAELNNAAWCIFMYIRYTLSLWTVFSLYTHCMVLMVHGLCGHNYGYGDYWYKRMCTISRILQYKDMV